ncbi:MAG TPA: flagellar biosynthetic protein FliO [Candidatus Binatia bacterium]|nr:flagellar biosynthetic protein FliO [Candidatus Binatia bacterium]
MSLAVRFRLPVSPARRMAHPAQRLGLPFLGMASLAGPAGRVRRPVVLAAATLVGILLLALGGRAAGLVPTPDRAATTAPTGAATAGEAVVGGWPPAPPATVALDPFDLGAKLALVGLLLYLALRLLRRFVGPAALGGGPIVVLASRPLGPKSALHLVALGERRLLVGESPAGLVGLTELSAEELALDDIETVAAAAARPAVALGPAAKPTWEERR